MPTNVEAIDGVLQFAANSSPFVAIAGPSGWGKTHLLECAANHLSKELNARLPVACALDWLNGRLSMDARRHIILDDAQDVLARTRSKYRFRLELERRVRIGLPTLLALTVDRPSRKHFAFLPNQREWRTFEVSEPPGRDRKDVVAQIARSEGIDLDRPLCEIIGTRMKGNGNTLHGAVVKLKSIQSRWQGDENTLRACGLLNLFFADSPDWDLREKISLAARATTGRFPELCELSLACFAMKHVAHLAESDVAHYCGISHARVHELSTRFQDRLSADPKTQAPYRHFLDVVVQNLA